MFKRRFYVRLADDAAGSTGGGAAVADAGAGAAAPAGGSVDAAGAVGNDSAASGSAGTGGSALAAGAASAAAAAGTGGAAGDAVDPNAWMPEKYRVKGEDGSLDVQASAKKVAEAYAHLEKRLGSGDAPPKSADEYAVNVPEALKDKINADELKGTESFKGFMGKLHAAGLSQKQADMMVSEFLERGVQLREANSVMAEAECVSTLKQLDGWKSDAEYKTQMTSAAKAARGFGEKVGVSWDQIIDSGLGNNPLFIRLMAAVGPEMGEDRGPSAEALSQVQDSLDQLMSTKAYLDSNDPAHASTVAKVNALFARTSGNRPIDGGMSLSFKT